MTHTPARRCCECQRPVPMGRGVTCSFACTVARRKRLRPGRHPVPWLDTARVRRKAVETRTRNHWRRKADARDAERRAA